MKIRLGIGLMALIISIATLMFRANSVNHNNIMPKKKTIITTYSILEPVVKDLVGDTFNVVSAIPNGFDLHEWEPSAKDVECLTKADLIIENGLNLENGMQKALNQARKCGVKFFTASDYIHIRHVGEGEGIPSGDPDQATGAQDPHIWTDPITVKTVIDALTIAIKKQFGIDLSARAAILGANLESLDAEIKAKVNTIPINRRKLVTGHESLGYFAQRYGFKIIGAVIPSLTTEAEGSAASLNKLKELIYKQQVPTIFTELGTPAKTTQALAKETKVNIVPIITHSLPTDRSYFSFEKELSNTIIRNLN